MAELWELKMAEINWNMTAEEKAACEDRGSIMELTTVGEILSMSLVTCALGLYAYFWHSSLGPVLTIIFALLGFLGVEFFLMAIYKWERDKYWRAIDVLKALDLRHSPGRAA